MLVGNEGEPEADGERLSAGVVSTRSRAAAKQHGHSTSDDQQRSVRQRVAAELTRERKVDTLSAGDRTALVVVAHAGDDSERDDDGVHEKRCSES
eukprot:3025516-Pleurochrysis_carterae.AAC.3